MDNSRINAIRQKRQEYDKAQELEMNSIIRANDHAKAVIKGLVADFQELKELADEMQINGFQLGKVGYASPAFITNWWSHQIGFYSVEHPSSIKSSQLYTLAGFGIMNGGAFGEIDLVIDFNGNIISKGQIYDNGKMIDVINFANGFKEFKKQFLDYVDKTFC